VFTEPLPSEFGGHADSKAISYLPFILENKKNRLKVDNSSSRAVIIMIRINNGIYSGFTLTGL
jgi:hypothetical protein